MHHSRTYPYDEQNANYSTGHQHTQPGTNIPMSSQNFHRGSYEQQQNSAQYYVPSQVPNSTHHVAQSGQYMRAMSPISPDAHRFSSGGVPHAGYYQSPGVAASSSSPTTGYMPNTPYYNPAQYNPTSQHRMSAHNQSSRFIPTPSETANSYPSYPGNSRPMSPPQQHQSHSPEYYTTPDVQQHMASSSRSPLPRPSRISTSRARSVQPMASTSPTSASSPTGERYPCEKCGKTFSRSHDRKRHHETQHLPTPVIHRCRYCDKEFSRADSLKRHLDNGCDEMP